MNGDFSAIPVWVLAVLGVLAAVQITLDVIALVDLYRRSTTEVVFENKWVWVAIVMLVSVVGPIVYLVVGRNPVGMPQSAAPPASPSVRTEDIAEALYGPRDDPDQR